MMLPLESPRWLELDTFFGEPENLPKVLSEWIGSTLDKLQPTLVPTDPYRLPIKCGFAG